MPIPVVRLASWLAVCLLVGVPALAEEPATDGDFVPMFNGRDLDGWQRVNTAESTWSLADGPDGGRILVCSGKPIGELRTTRMYQNFVMELEWRHMRPRGNAGVFVWADDITAPGQPFHRGIEVQVLENAYGNGGGHTTHGDIFPIHGARMTPINGRGGGRAFPTENRSKPSPEWNHYRIECSDGEISLAVNGKVVTRGRECSPRKGYICLESEGGLVHYRNVRIRELPATTVAPEHVAIADRGYRCLYNGVDLDDWSTNESNAGHWRANDWVLHFDGASSDPDKSLRTTATLAENGYGFVFDVRLNAKSGTPSVNVGGLVIAIDETFREALHEEGRWNRFEGTRRGSEYVLTLNGREVARRKLNDLKSDATLALLPDGPVDFANIYVRDLQPE